MCTAFDSQYAHIPGPAYAPPRKRSPSFLSSVKGLIKRPSRTRLEVPPVDNQAFQSRSTSELSSRSRERSRSPMTRVPARSWEGDPRGDPHHYSRQEPPPREHIPSMIDYLTLAQLESVWYKQDTYRGCVSAPQTAPSPEIEQWQQQELGRSSGEVRRSPPLARHPALRVRGRSFDDSTAWSRPPSYRR